MNLKTILTIIFTIATIVASAQNENANQADNPYAQRLEVPQLRGGTNNLFIVHEVPDYGVNYVLEWNCRKKAQRWSAYQWYKSNSVENWRRGDWKDTDWGGDPFQEDQSIPLAYRSTAEMHYSNGYDRGHIVASADRVNSKDANEQTFYYSNMQPQVHNFNAGLWEKMEEQLRKWNVDSFRDTLYVVKGGTIDHEGQILETTNKGLLVPKYFFMGVLCLKNQQYKALGFWAEHKANTGSDVATYAVTIDQIEKMTGIDLFCNLPDEIEEQVEATLVKSEWNLTGDEIICPDIDNTEYPALDDDLDIDPIDDDNQLWSSTIAEGNAYHIATFINDQYKVMSLAAENATNVYIPVITVDTEAEIADAASSCDYMFEEVGVDGIYRIHDSMDRYLLMRYDDAGKVTNTIGLSGEYTDDDAFLWKVAVDSDGILHMENQLIKNIFRYGSSKYGYGVYKSSGTMPRIYLASSSSGVESPNVCARNINNVYTIDGRTVDCPLSELSRGIYIIRTAQGQTRKIYIK